MGGGAVVPVAKGGGSGNAGRGGGDDARDGLCGEIGKWGDELAVSLPKNSAAEQEKRDVGADSGGEAEAGGVGQGRDAVREEFGLEGEERGGGVGRAGSEAALDGEALFDVDVDRDGEVEMMEREVDGLPGGVAVVEGNAEVVGGEADFSGRGRDGGDGDKLVEGEGLVESGEGVEAVGARWADAEAEIDFGEGAQGGRHRISL